MSKILDFIRKDLHLALTIAVVCVIVTAALVSRDRKCFTTESAPNGIISLELASTHEEATAVVASWSSVLNDVRWSIYADFAFIFAYTFGLFVLLVMAEKALEDTTIPVWKTPAWITKIALVLPLVAFACDIVENTFMLIFLPRQAIPIFLFTVPAWIKFGCIILVLVYCVAAPMVHRHVLKASRLYAPGLITVIISYFVFIRLEQGQDIMIQVIEWGGPTYWSLLCAILWVWYMWYSSRLVAYAKMQQPGGLVPPAYHRQFPRLLAFNGLVSLQAASLALPTLGNFSASELWLFVIVQNGVYFLWDDYVGRDSRRRWYSLLLVGLFSVIYGILLIEIVVNGEPGVKQHRWWLLIDGVIYLISLVLIWMWSIRRKDLGHDEKVLDPCDKEVVYTDYLKIFNIKVLGLTSDTFSKEQPWFRVFNGLAIVGFILYVAAARYLGLADRMGSLAFVLLAFGILVGLSNIITIFSLFRKTNFFFVFFVLAVVVGFFYDPFKVRLLDTKPAPRTDMITYFDKWVDHRRAQIDSSTIYPVYVVIADGGASRSGYWVSSVLSKLQDESILRHEKDPAHFPTIFSDHLLCLAGASGGSVGNATFYAMLKGRLIDGVVPGDTTSYWWQSRSFLKNDFLTPVLTHWLGSDFFQHIIPLKNVEDRAGILEEAMERFSVKSNIPYDAPFDQVIDQSGRLPMLFINVTSLHDGLPAVVSSVPVKSFSERVDIMKQLEDLGGGSIRYSTGVVLGARFPYVSPAGRIGDDYYVDGGYFDNTGAGIVHEMMQEVDSVKNSRNDSIYKKLQFRLVYLSNSPFEPIPNKDNCSGYKESSNEIHPLSNDLAAPILTVLGTYGTQTDVNNKRLENFMSTLKPKGTMYTVNLYEKPKKADTLKIYPMNWVISDYNLRRMDARLKRAKREEFDLILPAREGN